MSYIYKTYCFACLDGDYGYKKDAAAIGFDDQLLEENWNRRPASGICRFGQMMGEEALDAF